MKKRGIFQEYGRITRSVTITNATQKSQRLYLGVSFNSFPFYLRNTNIEKTQRTRGFLFGLTSFLSPHAVLSNTLQFYFYSLSPALSITPQRYKVPFFFGFYGFFQILYSSTSTFFVSGVRLSMGLIRCVWFLVFLAMLCCFVHLIMLFRLKHNQL